MPLKPDAIHIQNKYGDLSKGHHIFIIEVGSKLLYEHLLAVDDVQAFGWVLNLAALQIVLCALTMPSYRNPSGITYGYTSLDKMLPALSKLFTILFYHYLLTIYDVNTLCWVLNLAALQIVNTFHLSVFTFHLFNRAWVG